MRTIALLQGLYFFLTGIWPLVSIDTFQAVTGPKTDLWLVKTVGVLVAVIGVILLASGLRGVVAWEVFLLAVGSAAVLTAVDINYAVKRVISKIYLADAVMELMLILLWVGTLIVGS